MSRISPYEEDLGELGERGRLRHPQPRIRRVPYDYVVDFSLTGNTGNVLRSSMNISTDAWFICSAIGHCMHAPTTVDNSRLNDANILKSSPTFYRGVLNKYVTTIDNDPQTALFIELLKYLQMQNMQESCTFLYSIIDQGPGYELQNQPIHNLAGLGTPDGERPFRQLVVPYIFSPNTSIVVEVKELTTVAGGKLYMDFQGYKEFR